MPTSTEETMDGATSTLNGKATRIGGEMTHVDNPKEEGDLDKTQSAAQTLKGKARDVAKRGMNKG